MIARLSIALLSMLLAAAAGAETAYVTDMLQLGLHRAADTSDRAFENLISGTRLEVLERRTHYARVRTGAGDEGWVKAAYIVTETPPRYRLTELESEVESLRQELAAARATERRAVDDAARVRAREAESQESFESLRDAVALLEHQNADYAERVELYRGSLPLPWVLGALALTFVVGGAAGWWALDLLLRRRHAGYRLY